MASISPRTGLATSTGMAASAWPWRPCPGRSCRRRLRPWRRRRDRESERDDARAKKNVCHGPSPVVAVMTSQTPQLVANGAESRGIWCCSQLQHHVGLRRWPQAPDWLIRASCLRCEPCGRASNGAGRTPGDHVGHDFGGLVEHGVREFGVGELFGGLERRQVLRGAARVLAREPFAARGARARPCAAAG